MHSRAVYAIIVKKGIVMAGLERFLSAQENYYTVAVNELKSGRKASHRMWFIFPQISGLGSSAASKFYAIKNLDEAREYLLHPLPSKRLVYLCEILLSLNTYDISDIFSHTDSLKLCASMTLFSVADEKNSVFDKVLNKYFDGHRHKQTLALLNTCDLEK